MDVATNKIEKFSYKPWGMRRNASNWTTNVTMDVAGRFSRGYCMHEHLPELGLIDMGGRMYNARTNQFLSPDPYVQSPGSWLSHNRFAYCMQNPVWRTDPTGEFSTEAYYIGVLFDYAEMMAKQQLALQQVMEGINITIQTTVASAQSAAAGAASSTAYGYAFSYNPADYSYNPSVVNNVYAAISQNTQNAVASAKNAVASVETFISNFVPDFVTVSAGVEVYSGFGTGKFIDFSWITKGSEKSFLPLVTYTTKYGAGLDNGLGISLSAGYYSGKDQDVRRGMLLNNSFLDKNLKSSSIGTQIGFSYGIDATIGYSYSPMTDGNFVSTFDVGIGVGYSPVVVSGAASISNTYLIKDFR